jgi:ribosome recycling factor
VTVIADILADTSGRMDRAVEAAKEDFATVRTGRANPQLFQKVMVDYYGSPTPLVAAGVAEHPEARTLVVTPYDKSALKAIEQAIRDIPNLGVNPTNDGNLVRVTMPELTAERRKEYVKLVRTKGEDAKVHLRGIRRKAKDELDALKSEVGEDDLVRAEKELDAVTARTSTRSMRRSSAKRPSFSRSEAMTDPSGEPAAGSDAPRPGAARRARELGGVPGARARRAHRVRAPDRPRTRRFRAGAGPHQRAHGSQSADGDPHRPRRRRRGAGVAAVHQVAVPRLRDSGVPAGRVRVQPGRCRPRAGASMSCPRSSPARSSCSRASSSGT